jgi:peptide/nickel transport system permease protein
MLAYLVRRIGYGFFVVLGVLLFLFVLFFGAVTPEDMARRAIGEKAPPQAIAQWITNHGYDRPRLWNAEDPTDTLLFDHFHSMLSFDFGRSDADDVEIARRLREGIGPSFSLTVPLFLLGLLLGIALSLFVAYFRDTSTRVAVASAGWGGASPS